MNSNNAVKLALSQFARVTSDVDGVRVTTQCMYPSGAFVKVVVRGGEETFYVSDEGAAVAEIEAAGAWIEKPDRVLSQFVTPMGLAASNGVIMTRSCPESDLALAIAAVANASKHAADWLFLHMKIKPAKDFKVVVANFLRSSFETVRSDVIVGGSNKAHKFENIIALPNNHILVVDPVINDRSSINARVVANMDLKAAGHPEIEQRIVYDDSEDWKPEDINILQVGAPVVPYSKARGVLERISHGR